MEKAALIRLLKWSLGCDTGASSKFMASWLLAVAKPDCWREYPSDPSDLGRCLRLLRIVPELSADFARMAHAGPVWAALVARWGELERSMAEECGIDGEKQREAPRTYALMNSIIRPIEEATRFL